MPATIRGSGAATEQSPRYRFAPGIGWIVQRVWCGPKASVLGLATQLAGAGWEVELDQDAGPLATLRAQVSLAQVDGSTETAVDNWEFLPNTVEKDLLQSNAPILAGLGGTERQKIRKAWENKTDDTLPSSLTGNSLLIYKLMLKGVSAVRVHQPILRHVYTVSRNYSTKAALTNVGKVLSTTALQAAEAIPSTILFTLPTDSNPAVDDGVTMQYGWLKGYPTVQEVAFNRFQVSQEWEYGLWPTASYVHV